VMSDGRVEQVGTPNEVYEEPRTTYVADFLGGGNLMEAPAAGPAGNGLCKVRLGDFQLMAGQGESDARGDVRIVIRPERVGLEAQGAAGEDRVPGMGEGVGYGGALRPVHRH